MRYLKLFLLICMAAMVMAGCASGTDLKNENEAEVDSSIAESTETISETDEESSEEAVPETTIEETSAYVFENVNETVYAVENVNIRAGHSTESEIYAVLYKGEEIVRNGYSEEWSRVIYNDTECYIASAYLSSDKPVLETESELTSDTLSVKNSEELPSDTVSMKNKSDLPFDISSLKTAAQTTQIVAAVGDGSVSGATVYLFEKDSDNVWNMTFETQAYWGRKGISYNTIEGDNTTPAGVYDLGIAFGIKPNPGTALEWLDVNEYMYWIDDVNSEYYNQLIDSREIPDGWSSGEHLIDYAGYYDYSINIEVNPNCIRPGSTSAIFLHCGNSASAGCVSVSEESMITILQRLKPGAKMIIAENSSALYNY